MGHRSIVRIFDFLEEPDGTLVLVMELLRGETLEQWIVRRGPVPTHEALAVMAAVLSALQHGHEQGVVHRDVKPSNIFLAVDPDGRVIPKLLDYGIAKMPRNDRSKTMDGVVLGTPSYMSPEQIRAEPDLDGRSDLFSCAVVLYEMLTAICPFQATTPSAAIAAVLQSSVDPDPRIVPRLWLEVQRALSKRPKQRHDSAAAMRTAMFEALGESEDSLAPALQRIVPEDNLPHSGISFRGMPDPEAQTQSVEGQSVATQIPGVVPRCPRGLGGGGRGQDRSGRWSGMTLGSPCGWRSRGTAAGGNGGRAGMPKRSVAAGGRPGEQPFLVERPGRVAFHG